MSDISKRRLREEVARRKVESQRVYISGFIGHHPLDVGVAYWYRGHYIYAFPNGNIIQPVSFSTSHCIMINGIIQVQAPKYNPQAAGSVLETSVAALDKSKANEWERQQQEKYESMRHAAEIAELEKKVDALTSDDAGFIHAVVEDAGASGLRPNYPRTRVIPDTVLPSLLRPSSNMGSHVPLTDLDRSSTATTTARAKIVTAQAPSMPSLVAYAPQAVSFRPAFTPHDRAQFLAASAPGSHNASLANTPYASRPATPVPDHGFHGMLRPGPSVSRATSLLMEEGIRRAFSPLENVTEGKIPRAHTKDQDTNLQTESTDWEKINTLHSLPPSSTITPSPYIPATTSTTLTSQKPRPFLSSSRNRPLDPSRLRHASVALNSAYNASHPSPQNSSPIYPPSSNIPSLPPPTTLLTSSEDLSDKRAGKCPIHGEECDGMTVTRKWQTQTAIEGKGFIDLYPMIVGDGGRRMIDWARMLKEGKEMREREKEKKRMEKEKEKKD